MIGWKRVRSREINPELTKELYIGMNIICGGTYLEYISSSPVDIEC